MIKLNLKHYNIIYYVYYNNTTTVHFNIILVTITNDFYAVFQKYYIYSIT